MRLRVLLKWPLPLARSKANRGMSVQFTKGLGPWGTCAYVGIQKERPYVQVFVLFYFMYKLTI